MGQGKSINGGEGASTVPVPGWKQPETMRRDRLAPRANLISQNVPIKAKLGLMFAMPGRIGGLTDRTKRLTDSLNFSVSMASG
jgi:hypothetical protein